MVAGKGGETRHLEKSKIILTRPAEKFSPVNGPHCFEYVDVPLTETIPRPDIHEIMTSIKNYDPKILVFTSTVGVDIFITPVNIKNKSTET